MHVVPIGVGRRDQVGGFFALAILGVDPHASQSHPILPHIALHPQSCRGCGCCCWGNRLDAWRGQCRYGKLFAAHVVRFITFQHFIINIDNGLCHLILCVAIKPQGRGLSCLKSVPDTLFDARDRNNKGLGSGMALIAHPNPGPQARLRRGTARAGIQLNAHLVNNEICLRFRCERDRLSRRWQG